MLRAPSFRITSARWLSNVLGLMPMRKAPCLLVWPSLMSFKTSRSRRVRGFWPTAGGRAICGVPTPSRAQSLRFDASVHRDNGDYLKITEACMRIFDRQEWLRVNRARARIKVLVDKIGIDEFRELVEEELQGDWVSERDFSLGDFGVIEGGSAVGPARKRRIREAVFVLRHVRCLTELTWFRS